MSRFYARQLATAALTTFAAFTFVAAPPLANADEKHLIEHGAASADQLRQLARDHAALIETLEQRHQRQVEALTSEIDLLRRRIAKIEKARDLEDRQRARDSFNKRRTLNWPLVSSGMSRRDIYRLIGSGTKDRTETERDCRCFSQGRICFSTEDIAAKSNVRCQL